MGHGDPDFATRLFSALPGAAFVIDGVGTIRYATEPAAALVGLAVADLTGRSVLDFVDDQTAWAYAAAVAMATDYPSTSMGPLRVTFIGDHGTRSADLWATNHLDDPAIEGIVCLLTEETTAVGLGEAIESVAVGSDLGTVTARVTRAMRGQPVSAQAAVVRLDDDGFTVIADGGFTVAPDGSAAGPAADRSTGDAPGDGPVQDAPISDLATGPPRGLPAGLFADDRPWRDAVATGIRVLHSTLDDLRHDVQATARAAGFAALWVEPVRPLGEQPPVAALVLWRSRPGPPSPNQLNSIHQAAGILTVAVTLDALGSSTMSTIPTIPGTATPGP